MKYIRIIRIIFLCLSIGLASNCADYLDIVPDEIITMDKAFSNRVNARKFFYTCYGYLPSAVRFCRDPGMLAAGGDELWVYAADGRINTTDGFYITRGLQNASAPYTNYWDGVGTGNPPLYQAIRDCNIFLENIGMTPDLPEDERRQWIAEVKFLKAWYHFYLMHLYGPIPIVRENLAVNASPEEVRVFRDPIDDVVNYIVELLDEAVDDLPEETWVMQVADGGRITKPIALAVKAKALVWAASPLFNGNGDYADFKDSRGVQLIPSGAADLSKWERAATAVKEAIDMAHRAGHELYKEEFFPANTERAMSDETKLKYVLRYAVTDKFNREIIWPSTHYTNGYGGWGVSTYYIESTLQWNTMPWITTSVSPIAATEFGKFGTTLNVVEQFYTNNGIPYDEDPEWRLWTGGSLERRYEITTAATDSYHRYYIKAGEITSKVNFYREPRFYAYVGFDRGIWEGAGKTEDEGFYLQARPPGQQYRSGQSVGTGYFCKKLVHPQSMNDAADAFRPVNYTFPYIRLSDLYLLYAEALNEMLPSEDAVPAAEVYEWIDKVRTRAGLLGVKDSWKKSLNPQKPDSKRGMREIIRRERLIELCFEGQRAPDLRRWKEAFTYFNKPLIGWSNTESVVEDYYQVRIHNQRRYAAKDYLWPIRSENIDINTNLVQNPGW